MRFSSISKKIGLGVLSFALIILLYSKAGAQLLPPTTSTTTTPASDVLDTGNLNPQNDQVVPLTPTHPSQQILTTDKSTYNLLSPLGSFKQFTLACTIDETGKEKCPGLSEFLGIIFSLSIALAGVLAVIMIMVGGWTLMYSDSFTGRNEGREKIENAIWGLVLALSSYLILNTINPDLVNLSLQISGATIEIQESEGDTPQPAPENGSYCKGRVTAGVKWTPPTDDAERDQLSQGGVTVNKSNCSSVGSQSCTSVKGLSSTAISKLIQLKTTCVAFNNACKIEVTGGTECWLHSAGTNHFTGGSTVDLHNDPQLVKYIQNNSTSKKDTKHGWTAYEMNKGPFSGAVFVQEGDHFHVKNW